MSLVIIALPSMAATKDQYKENANLAAIAVQLNSPVEQTKLTLKNPIEKAQELAEEADDISLPFKKRQKLEAAIALLEQAANGNSQNSDEYYLLGTTAVKIQEVAATQEEWLQMEDIAIKAFEKAVTLDPNNEHAWADLAEVYFSHSEELCNTDPDESIRLFDKADAVFQRALKAMPESNLLWYLWASDYAIHAYNIQNPERRELREQAADKFKKAISFMPDDEYSWRMLAKVWWRIADDLPENDPELPSLWTTSLNSFMEAYKLTPKGSAFKIATLNALLGKDSETCRPYLEKALSIGDLPSGQEILEMPAFQRFHNQEWFQKMISMAM